jgi:hypothetical protein
MKRRSVYQPCVEGEAVNDGYGAGSLRCSSRICHLAVIISTTFWALLFYFHYAMQGNMASVVIKPSSFSLPSLRPSLIRGWLGQDRCAGRRIYMYDLPPRFNADLALACSKFSAAMDMCRHVANDGFGVPLVGGEGTGLPERGAYDTDQYTLAMIFHARMRRYECLTGDAAAADAVFVPVYAGFDASLTLWQRDVAARDALPRDLVAWLMQRREWRAMGGRDHFLVLGRGTWDFNRRTDGGWGNALMTYPAIRNTTLLTIEASPWLGNDFGVPFPSHFHPSSDADVAAWQDFVRRAERKWLWAFAGAPLNPGRTQTVRAQIIEQCQASAACGHLGGNHGLYNSPGRFMQLMESAVFCVQPRGDSFTRKATFDAILAGCIPVFFHPVSAYLQYSWHLPRDYRSYSVFIPHSDVEDRNASIEAALRRIPPATVARMQEQVIRLIPRVMYRDPAATQVSFKDAFDVAVDAVLHRVAKRRRAAAEGREYQDSVDGPESWKYDLLEDGEAHVGPHEFDAYFGLV